MRIFLALMVALTVLGIPAIAGDEEFFRGDDEALCKEKAGSVTPACKTTRIFVNKILEGQSPGDAPSDANYDFIRDTEKPSVMKYVIGRKMRK